MAVQQGLSLFTVNCVGLQGLSLSTIRNVDVQSMYTSYIFFLNAGMTGIWSVRYKNDKKCRCRNHFIT
jgi:hypothetical protein